MKFKSTNGITCEIDSDQFKKLSRHNWFADRRNGIIYFKTKINGETTYLHRVVMQAKKGQVIDHINRNTLNNKRDNLRFATNGENRRNYVPAKKNMNGFRGVTRVRNRYRAELKINYKVMRKGFFDTPLEAAQAYDVMAIKYHKEFAILNFPRNILKVEK